MSRVDPWVLQQVREGLRSRGYWVAHGVQALVALGLVLAHAVWAWGSLVETRWLLWRRLFGVLGVVYLLVIPAVAYARLLRARGSGAWAERVRAQGARRVIAGEVAVLLTRAGLLYAGSSVLLCLLPPSMKRITFQWVLLPNLTGGLFWLVFLGVGAVCAALVPRVPAGWRARVVVPWAMLAALAWFFWRQGFFSLDRWSLAAEEVLRGRSPLLTNSSLYRCFGAMLWMLFSGACLLHETACAWTRLAPEPPAHGPRRLLAVQVGLSALLMLVLWPYDEPAYAEERELCIVGCLYLTVCGFVLTRFPGASGAPRGPGPVGGLWLVVGLMLGWGGVCGLLNRLMPRQPRYDDFHFSDHGQDPFNAPLVGVLAPAVLAVLFLSLALWPRRPAWLATVPRYLLLVVLVSAGLSWRSDVLGRHAWFDVFSPWESVFGNRGRGFVLGDSSWHWRALGLLGVVTGLSVFLAHRALSARHKALAA